MPEYKLVYFNGTGRAELIRWLFAYGGVKYTDDRFDESEWAARKTKTYGGRVPLLMVDDKPLPQSLAQARYAAREVGLMPTDSLQAAYCDAVVDSIEEIYCKYFPLWFVEGTEGEIANKFKELHTSAISPFADKLNKRLKEKQWFVGDQMSWADFAIAVAADQMKQKMPYILEKYPAVDQHVKKVMDLPQIKAWVAKRPKGLF